MNAARRGRLLALLLIGALTSAATVLGFALHEAGEAKPTLAAPAITPAHANPTNITTAPFVFTGPSGANFQCQLDSAAFAPCTTPKSYSALTQGAHTFAVRSVSGSGVSSATTSGWIVDTIAPPAPHLVQKPDDPTFNATNTFTWTEAEVGASFQCSFENGSWTPCSSPYSYVIVTSNYGQHQFSVRAVDAAGNVSAATSYSYKYAKGLPTSGLPFTISRSVSGLSIGVWKPIVVKITNPNGVLIYVSALNVAISANSTPPGCYSAANVELQQSNVSTSLSVAVPAHSSVVLPSGPVTAPRIRLIDLPNTNQDECKGKSFALTYSGTANN